MTFALLIGLIEQTQKIVGHIFFGDAGVKGPQLLTEPLRATLAFGTVHGIFVILVLHQHQALSGACDTDTVAKRRIHQVVPIKMVFFFTSHATKSRVTHWYRCVLAKTAGG